MENKRNIRRWLPVAAALAARMVRGDSLAETARWAVGAGLITGTDAGALNYLRGRVFTVADVPFRDKYFPAPETPKKIPVKPR